MLQILLPEINQLSFEFQPPPGKKVAGFKFTSNQGRTTLQRGVDERKKFYEYYSIFVKDMIKKEEGSK